MSLPQAGLEAMLPKGVKDFLPLKAAKIEFLDRTLRRVFARWAFRPIIPPSLEFLHVLEKGMGENLREKTFRFDDRQSGKLVAFPPDITPQVARIAATRMRDLPLPLRLSYSGRVLRHTEQQAGKDREIFRAGVELIGLESAEADAEMIAMAVECLKSVGATEFTVDIGQVEFFRGVMAEVPLSESLARAVQRAIARKDTSGLATLLAEAPISEASRQEILAKVISQLLRSIADRCRKFGDIQDTAAADADDGVAPGGRICLTDGPEVGNRRFGRKVAVDMDLHAALA